MYLKSFAILFNQNIVCNKNSFVAQSPKTHTLYIPIFCCSIWLNLFAIVVLSDCFFPNLCKVEQMEQIYLFASSSLHD